MPDDTPVPVEQADREAAAELAKWLTAAQRKLDYMPIWFASDFPRTVKQGIWDEHEFVQAFARHRLSAQPGEGWQERIAKLEEALRKIESGSWPGITDQVLSGQWQNVFTEAQAIARAALAEETSGGQ